MSLIIAKIICVNLLATPAISDDVALVKAETTNTAIKDAKVVAGEVGEVPKIVNGAETTNTVIKDAEVVAGEAGKGSKGIINAEETKPSLPDGGTPKGDYEKPDVNEPGPITRQNEAAKLLASKGYDIEMLPNKIDGNGYGIDPTKSPDFLIEGKPFDCYSPSTSNIRNIWKTVADKAETQASRVVLNLDDYSGSMDALNKQFNDWPIDTLKELKVIKDGQIFTWINK